MIDTKEPSREELASKRRTPAQPFYFNTSAHLLRIAPQRANTLADLRAALGVCPEGSIFLHTFRTLQEHHFIRDGYNNDFAHWVLHSCQEPGLAKQLASVDVREFTSLPALRERLIQIVSRHLESNPASGTRPAKKAFYFCLSDVVVIPTNFVARTMAEFVQGLKNVSVHSIHHHFIEARLRLKLVSNDFSQWLQAGGLTEAGHALNRIDIYQSTLEEVRQQIIQVVERASK